MASEPSKLTFDASEKNSSIRVAVFADWTSISLEKRDISLDYLLIATALMPSRILEFAVWGARGREFFSVVLVLLRLFRQSDLETTCKTLASSSSFDQRLDRTLLCSVYENNAENKQFPAKIPSIARVVLLCQSSNKS